MSTVIFVFGTIIPIVFAWYQSRKQQKITDKQKVIQRTKTQIDCSNWCKEMREEIIQEYSRSKNLGDKIDLLLSPIYREALCQCLKTVRLLIILIQFNNWESEMSENTASVISAVFSGLSAIAAWVAILYGCWKDKKQQEQSKKQQEIIDRQNNFLRDTERLDVLYRQINIYENILEQVNLKILLESEQVSKPILNASEQMELIAENQKRLDNFTFIFSFFDSKSYYFNQFTNGKRVIELIESIEKRNGIFSIEPEQQKIFIDTMAEAIREIHRKIEKLTKECADIESKL